MEIILNNKKLHFLIGHQNNPKHRNAFNNLAIKIFDLSFEEWYQSGYWKEKYIPYTLFHEEKAVANVSINIMDFKAFGRQQRYIQLGTVMTDPKYRNQGLSRFLMEKICQDWNGKCDFIYLYANGSVLDFYPKFNFKLFREYEYFKKTINNAIKPRELDPFDMGIQSNRDMLYDYAKNSRSFSKLSMNENADLVMFYCITVLKECVYYIESLDVFAIAKFKDNCVHLLDIFGKRDIELDEIIHLLANSSVNEVLLGFTPQDINAYQVREILGDDFLFIQNHKTEMFVENKLMFPCLSHA